jgi:hypothetical protein
LSTYGIAIQVKDYQGIVGDRPLEQVRQATEYWDKRGIKILELVVVLINCEKSQNLELIRSADLPPSVRIVWSSDILDFIARSGYKFLSESDVVDDSAPISTG